MQQLKDAFKWSVKWIVIWFIIRLIFAGIATIFVVPGFCQVILYYLIISFGRYFYVKYK